MEVAGYKISKSKFGIRYMKDGRLIKAVDVPQDIKDKLDTVEANTQLDPHACIFCGAHAAETRFINLQTIALCSDDYYAKNVGQIAQRLREIYNGESTVKEFSS